MAIAFFAALGLTLEGRRHDRRRMGRPLTVPGATRYVAIATTWSPPTATGRLELSTRLAPDLSSLTIAERTAALALIDAVVGGYRWSPAGAARNDLVLQVARTRASPPPRHPGSPTPSSPPPSAARRLLARLAAIVDRYSGWHFVNDRPRTAPHRPRRQPPGRTFHAPSSSWSANTITPDFQHMADLPLPGSPPVPKSMSIRDAGHMANMEAPAAVTRGTRILPCPMIST